MTLEAQRSLWGGLCASTSFYKSMMWRIRFGRGRLTWVMTLCANHVSFIGVTEVDINVAII